ncbi:MAG: hypothetical protein EOO43_22830 [Flavobacterium sp.]|nr:MAG: hypothetical protein EOO43_22830 [Flavobacterium sp.]
MKLEYLHDMTDGGKYKPVTSENLIRLFDFDQTQTTDLTSVIYHSVLIDKQQLDLSSLAFIELVNCKLVLQLSSNDNGILKTDEPNQFTCELTEETFKAAIELMKAVDSGYNWLCDTSEDNIDFLYSPGGTW